MNDRQGQDLVNYAALQDAVIALLLHEFNEGAYEKAADCDRCEIIYLRQGEASLQIGGRTIEARSGAVIVVGAGTECKGSFRASDRNGKQERYILGLRELHLPDRLPGHVLEVGSSPVVRLDMNNILTGMFQLIEREYLARETGWECICMGTMHALVTMVARGVVPQENDTPPQPLSQAQTLAGEILAYLRAHYCENISLQSVADHFYISPYYLSHLMKKQFQIPLMQYVIHLRIAEAQTLLRDTDYPVRQIAQMVGYQNFNYFLNVFKKATGMSPGECRARSRDGAE